MFLCVMFSEAGGKKKRAKVLYSYEPENDDELKLEVGDMVDVLRQVRYFSKNTFYFFRNFTVGKHT